MNNRNSKNDKSREFNKIINKIEKIEMLKEELKPKNYADPSGHAYKIADRFGKTELNTNHLRKFFGAIRDIEMKKEWEFIEPEFYLLKPKIASSVGRKLILEDFHRLMMTCMSKIDVGNDSEKMENFKTLVSFLESIVAYRKYIYS